jgi:hypothetical protein
VLSKVICLPQTLACLSVHDKRSNPDWLCFSGGLGYEGTNLGRPWYRSSAVHATDDVGHLRFLVIVSQFN